MKRTIDKRLVSQFIVEMRHTDDHPPELKRYDELLIRTFLIWAQKKGFELVKVQNDQ